MLPVSGQVILPAVRPTGVLALFSRSCSDTLEVPDTTVSFCRTWTSRVGFFEVMSPSSVAHSLRCPHSERGGVPGSSFRGPSPGCLNDRTPAAAAIPSPAAHQSPQEPPDFTGWLRPESSSTTVTRPLPAEPRWRKQTGAIQSSGRRESHLGTLGGVSGLDSERGEELGFFRSSSRS